MSISSIRRDYQLKSLSEYDVHPDAMAQFTRWWDEAVHSDIDEVNAMTLATVAPDGMPSARIVLLKGYDAQGFVFFTNYESEKGRQLQFQKNASLLFFWKELERQIRIEGTVEKIPSAESDVYYDSRPFGSRLGAWASPQSQPIESREWLEKRLETISEAYNESNIKRPAHWGGYRVSPKSIEFWQGRSNRLHDRIKYTRSEKGWQFVRLAP